MVSGTYILTDTIKAAFDDRLHVAYTERRRGGHRQERDRERTTRAGPTALPSLPASLLPERARLPEVAQAGGGIADSAQLVGHNGKVISAAARRASRSATRPADQRFNPLNLVERRLPAAPDQIAIDADTASKKRFALGDRSASIARGPSSNSGSSAPSSSPASRRSAARRSRSSTCRRPSRSSTRQGSSTRSTSPPSRAVASTAARRRDPAGVPPTAQVRTGKAQAAAGDQGHEWIPHELPGLPARVRRDRAVRRQLRDRQHAVDHHRPAHARVGTLRTLGATRRQVMLCVMAEGFVIGVVASIVGLFLGWGSRRG